ncbi:hypothetical protein JCM6882_008031 [Rhodosporidiobolus microsporus]
MSSKPHKFWPSEGSTWQHWSDLLLATQLAAARAGFTSLSRDWHPDRPDTLKVKCTVRPGDIRKGRCHHSTVVAQAVNPHKPDEKWKVVLLQAENLESSRHPEHKGGLGLSEWLKERPKTELKIAAGDEIVGYRAFHTFEGALRAAARRSGHFVSGGSTVRDNDVYAFVCVLDTCDCNFLIRFRQLEKDAGEEPRWRCIEVRSKHSCTSSAKDPQERLTWRMDFFFVSQVDRRMGPFPPSLANAPVFEPSMRLTSASTPAAATSAPPSSRLLKAQSALTAASTSLNTAESTVARLQAELEAAEKVADEKRKLVEKRRKKVERVREKEKGRKAGEKIKKKSASTGGKSTSSALDKLSKKARITKVKGVREKKKKGLEKDLKWQRAGSSPLHCP